MSVINTLLPNDQYDYIIVVMQKTQVYNILSALSQNCSKNIVFVVNTASGYDCSNFKLGRSYKDVKQVIRGIQEGRRVLRKNGVNPTPKKLLCYTIDFYFWVSMPQRLQSNKDIILEHFT